ncbi:hypothetical protein [Nitrospirillum iridis]|uniref:Uncharacterized protein n=1 Tax=Nitrospirillum iridis TaxID=765888 RepID=A0A7X0EC06_9PROT|nr:hypothetical protein [Nitrospirillum iridis]MBB6249496.1 hypothetical protein [Nitrospirillum iridis]
MPSDLANLMRRFNDRGRGVDLMVLVAVSAFLTAVVLSAPPEATQEAGIAPDPVVVSAGR